MNIKTEINDKVFENFPVMKTERLLLRNVKSSDAESIFKLRSNDQVMIHMDSDYHNSVEDALKFIKLINDDYNDKSGINWAIELTGTNEMIGYVCFHRLDRANCRGEMGYALHPDYWRKGYTAEAIREVVKFGFDKMDLHGIDANVNPKNEASKSLLKKLGFKMEAYFRENYLRKGVFMDSEIYCMICTDKINEE
jgi:[ribosomal protein S5]-alanine N-acetyltransferase